MMDDRLDEIQDAMEQKMASMKLSDVIEDTESLVAKQKKLA